MGNIPTNLDISPLFEGDVRDNHVELKVKVVVEGLSPVVVWFCESDSEMANLKPESIHYEFCPKTHMRDFEVVTCRQKELKIARGQGLCVIVCDMNTSYAKLYEKDGRIETAVFCNWNHEQESMDLLSSDLAIGYDVLFVKNPRKFQRLCEERDERDGTATVVIFDHLKHLAQYDRKRKAESVDSDSSEDSSSSSEEEEGEKVTPPVSKKPKTEEQKVV